MSVETLPPPLPTPLLALIVVTHDSGPWLAGLAASWEAAVRRFSAVDGDGTLEVIIADSGSSVREGESIGTLWPGAKVISCGDIGFGAAANRGVAATAAQWLLICNPDIVLPEEFLVHFFAAGTDVAATPGRDDAACFAPRLINGDGSVQPSVGRFPTLGGLIRDQFRPRMLRKYVRPQPVQSGAIDWATGACLLIRRDAFKAVCGFDEQFFLYMEEVDLQRRLRDSGFSVGFVPELKVRHEGPNAARPVRPQIQLYAARGLLRYFAKHGGAASLWGFRILALGAGRLTPREALASRQAILRRPTGP